jgi:hypothetical protein
MENHLLQVRKSRRQSPMNRKTSPASRFLARRSFRALLLSLCSVVSPGALEASDAVGDSMHCSLNESFLEGGGREIEAKLVYDRGQLRSVSLSASISDGEEGGGSLCSIDIDRLGSDVAWTRDGATDRLDTSAETGDPSMLSIETTKDGFVIFPADLSRYYCGFGAEWPTSISVSRGVHDCAVTFR